MVENFQQIFYHSCQWNRSFIISKVKAEKKSELANKKKPQTYTKSINLLYSLRLYSKMRVKS